MVEKELYLNSLNNISTIDGREILFAKDLSQFLSEGALHRYRGIIEVENLISLSETKFFPNLEISEKEKKTLREIISLNFPQSQSTFQFS